MRGTSQLLIQCSLKLEVGSLAAARMARWPLADAGSACVGGRQPTLRLGGARVGAAGSRHGTAHGARSAVTAAAAGKELCSVAPGAKCPGLLRGMAADAKLH